MKDQMWMTASMEDERRIAAIIFISLVVIVLISIIYHLVTG